jgi:peptidoglycan/LPS O-acetylase OafA/YrhL
MQLPVIAARSARKLPEIERLRGVAILMVLVMHWGFFQALLPSLARSPWTGVDLFFVISGYVVTLSLTRLLPPLEGEASFAAAFARAGVALKTFYARRFFRIVPAVVLVVLVHRFLAGAAPREYGSIQQSLTETVAFFSGIYNYHVAMTGQDKLTPLWSLSVEEHFYLILPVLFVAMRTTSKRLAACAGIILFCMLARHFDSAVDRATIHADWTYNPFAWDKYSSHLRFDSLMAGVGVALLGPAKPAVRPILPKAFVRFGIVPACIALIMCLPGASSDQVLQAEEFVALWMLSAILVAFAAIDSGYVLSFPVVGRILEYIGSRSYALYLVHYDLAKLDDIARREWPTYGRWIPLEPVPIRRAALVFGVALLAAELLHRLVERPFIAYGRAITEGASDESASARAPGGAAPRPPRALRAGLAAAGVLAVAFVFRHRIEWLVLPHNLARGALVRASSLHSGQADAQALVNGEFEPEYGVVTNSEERPWFEIDLGQPTQVEAIRIYNRADGYEEEALPLEVSLSEDGASYRLVARIEHSFTQDWAWRVSLRRHDPVRFVRLQLAKNGVLCLSEVQVFAEARAAALP